MVDEADDPFSWSQCYEYSYEWNEWECDEKTEKLISCDAMASCQDKAIGADQGAWVNYFGSMQFSAFLGCFTLLFALNGCLTRIRWRQDSNWQKVRQLWIDGQL